MSDPYLSSKKFKPNQGWYDCFVKSGEFAWIVFFGETYVARVENEQQCKNVLKFMRGADDGGTRTYTEASSVDARQHGGV
jgi:hypothetical protein